MVSMSFDVAATMTLTNHAYTQARHHFTKNAPSFGFPIVFPAGTVLDPRSPFLSPAGSLRLRIEIQVCLIRGADEVPLVCAAFIMV